MLRNRPWIGQLGLDWVVEEAFFGEQGMKNDRILFEILVCKQQK
jgi:hypothetical protein